MSINVCCPGCWSSWPLDAQRCKKCGLALVGKNRRYRVRLRVGGKWHSKVCDRLDVARAKEGEWRAEVQMTGRLQSKPKGTTLVEAWEGYHKSIKGKRFTKTLEVLWRLHVEPEIGQRRLDQIESHHIQNLGEKLTKKPASPVWNRKRYAESDGKKKTLSLQTVTHCLKLVRQIINHAIGQGLHSGPNPVQGNKLPKFDNRVTRALSQEQTTHLMDVLRQWPNQSVALAFKLCLLTGRRAGEVFGLEWEQVDFHLGVIEFRVKSHIEGERQHTPISQAVRVILEDARQFRYPDSPLVFSTRNGRRMSWRNYWLRIRKAAGIPEDFRPHDLRHTFASALASSGRVDLFALQGLLGHKTATMTGRYSHLRAEALRRGLGVAEEIFVHSADNK